MRRVIKRPAVVLGVLVVGGAALWVRQRAPRQLRDAAAAQAVSRVAMAMSTPAMSAPAIAADDALSTRPSVPLAFGGHKLIRSADVQVQVGDVAVAACRADSVAKAHAGFLAESHIGQTDRTTTDARVVIQVPADSFDDALSGVRQLGQPRVEIVGTSDVTREYADLDTRITVTDETAGRLRALLLNRPGQLSDILQVERELSRVVTELEQLKAQRHAYDRQVAMSSIAIRFFESGPAPPTPLMTLRASLADSMMHLTDVLIGSVGSIVSLVAYLVPWAILAALGWWCVRTVRRAY